MTAEAWFAEKRWPDDPHCPHCVCTYVQTGLKNKSEPYRCREKECRERFSAKTGTVIQASNLGCQIWAIAIYLSLASIKSVSSMKLHRDLNITQKSAWYLIYRLRFAFVAKSCGFSGPVEVHETFVGGKRANMQESRRKQLDGRGTVGKAVVAGMKDTRTNKVGAKVVSDTSAGTLQGFMRGNAEPGAKVYTDEAGAYKRIGYGHEAVKHSTGEYVRSRHGAYQWHRVFLIDTQESA